MTDIVERLRSIYDLWNGTLSVELPINAGIVLEAADEIERLQAAGNSGEPVAWRCIADDGVSDVTEVEGVADQWRSDGFAVAPLYAAPRQLSSRCKRPN